MAIYYSISEIQFFNTISPKGSWNFGIGQIELKLIFLACISINHCNLKAWFMVLMYFGWYGMLNLHDVFTIVYCKREINNYNLSSIKHDFTNNFELLSNFMTCTNIYSLKMVKYMFIYFLTSCLPEILNLSNLILLYHFVLFISTISCRITEISSITCLIWPWSILGCPSPHKLPFRGRWRALILWWSEFQDIPEILKLTLLYKVYHN